ncbi:hypothetical protein VP01_3370g1 [Puccinia sorghi]|uniref:Uncharacterized protein n=1 Tax=Puccinia sorghi TaxID=27349 RepID=A0A0L6UYR0_9BASI|nr:hypothetical protein VP01_3370g1 [Puccinia sorghi]
MSFLISVSTAAVYTKNTNDLTGLVHSCMHSVKQTHLRHLKKNSHHIPPPHANSKLTNYYSCKTLLIHKPGCSAQIAPLCFRKMMEKGIMDEASQALINRRSASLSAAWAWLDFTTADLIIRPSPRQKRLESERKANNERLKGAERVVEYSGSGSETVSFQVFRAVFWLRGFTELCGVFHKLLDFWGEFSEVYWNKVIKLWSYSASTEKKNLLNCLQLTCSMLQPIYWLNHSWRKVGVKLSKCFLQCSLLVITQPYNFIIEYHKDDAITEFQIITRKKNSHNITATLSQPIKYDKNNITINVGGSTCNPPTTFGSQDFDHMSTTQFIRMHIISIKIILPVVHMLPLAF